MFVTTANNFTINYPKSKGKVYWVVRMLQIANQIFIVFHYCNYNVLNLSAMALRMGLPVWFDYILCQAELTVQLLLNIFLYNLNGQASVPSISGQSQSNSETITLHSITCTSKNANANILCKSSKIHRRNMRYVSLKSIVGI